ncbi:hypothetical protein MVEN_01614000 [Mycena venus]|uniref:Uncharacterized protein n=1 Tax=Mycena venus TaxID=2733690 RepID=A0A8H6XQ39_9AGAR|nr:hypothetical protein MVEN_01614000 [Mycena venus]
MAFLGPFPSTSGPNDPRPALTPEQYALAIQHYHFMQNTLPHAPSTQLTTPVIDPSLREPTPIDAEERISSLEREVRELKAQKRTNPSTPDSSPKPRKKSKKPSLYILKDKKNLTFNQIEVRKVLMRKMKAELMALTGMGGSTDSESDDDNTPTSSSSTSAFMTFDFTANVHSSINMKILDHAADLIWTEQSDPKAATFSLPHKDVHFTRPDILEFGKTNFRSWKKGWKGANDVAIGERQLKQNRLKAAKEYKEKYKKNPVCVLETDLMSDEISQPDTDDDAKKADHRQRLIRAAQLSRAQQDQRVWEVVRLEFQSTECADVKDELDSIMKQRKQHGPNKPSHPPVIRVNLGNKHDRLPTGKIWPFMVSKDWYDAKIRGHPERENAFSMYTKNPDEFGEDLGYEGDDEGNQG